MVAFDLEKNWTRDVTDDIALAVIATARESGSKLSREAANFVERASDKEVAADLLETTRPAKRSAPL